jgi:hypothetical protein
LAEMKLKCDNCETFGGTAFRARRFLFPGAVNLRALMVKCVAGELMVRLGALLDEVCWLIM